MLGGAVGGERCSSGEALEQHAGQRVNVGTRPGSAVEAFRGHVGESADRPGLAGERGLTVGMCDPEVDQIGMAAGVQHDVGRFDVPVHQSRIVCGVESRSDLADHAHGAVERQGTFTS